MKRNDIIGQEEVWQRLMQMVQENRLPHALLFCGPAGSGKMATALYFATYLLCTNHNEKDEPCGTCRQCAMLNKWEHPDLHFTMPTIKLPSTGSAHKPISDDFAKEWRQFIMDSPYITIDKWMNTIGTANQQAIITAAESDSLSQKLSLKSSQGGYKVCLIWLPERMNSECANKMLKIIEEPPSQTVFILVSEEPGLLLETIRSRVQRIEFKRIDVESMTQALMGKRGLEQEDARRIARLADGNWNKATEVLEASSESEEFLQAFQSLMRLAYSRNIKELKRWSEDMNEYGREKQKRFLNYTLRLVRENFMYNFQIEELNYMTWNEEKFSQNFARFVNEDNILAIYDMLNLAIRDIGQNANAKIVFFDLSLQMIMMLKH